MGYPLGWSVVTQTLVRRERWPGGLKAKGTALVYPGQEVPPDQPVMRIEMTQLDPEKTAAPHFSLPTAGIGNMDSSTANSATDANGRRSGETIPAGMRGRVVDVTRRGGVVIESRAAVIQGAIGAGCQVAGVLTLWQAPDAGYGQQPIPPGAILVIPGPLNFAMLRQALSSNVSGVVASSISTRDLEGFLRADLVQLIDSMNAEVAQVHLPPITLLLSEGLGTIAMPARTIHLLSQYQGAIALLSGATSVRQGIFPELIISLPVEEAQQSWHPVRPEPALGVGAQVRICSGEYEGVIGEINYLFTHQQVFASGIRARAARLQLEDGSTLVVPMMLIERIG
jgi:hypothetical protein